MSGDVFLTPEYLGRGNLLKQLESKWRLHIEKKYTDVFHRFIPRTFVSSLKGQRILWENVIPFLKKIVEGMRYQVLGTAELLVYMPIPGYDKFVKLHVRVEHTHILFQCYNPNAKIYASPEWNLVEPVLVRDFFKTLVFDGTVPLSFLLEPFLEECVRVGIEKVPEFITEEQKMRVFIEKFDPRFKQSYQIDVEDLTILFYSKSQRSPENELINIVGNELKQDSECHERMRLVGFMGYPFQEHINVCLYDSGTRYYYVSRDVVIYTIQDNISKPRPRVGTSRAVEILEENIVVVSSDWSDSSDSSESSEPSESSESDANSLPDLEPEDPESVRVEPVQHETSPAAKFPWMYTSNPVNTCLEMMSHTFGGDFAMKVISSEPSNIQFELEHNKTRDRFTVLIVSNQCIITAEWLDLACTVKASNFSFEKMLKMVNEFIEIDE